VALDVLAGVTSEYLLNVGRTLRFLCDKYSNSMTAEVNVLCYHCPYLCQTSPVFTGNYSSYVIRKWNVENPRSRTLYQG
jgi:hypothetical protein